MELRRVLEDRIRQEWRSLQCPSVDSLYGMIAEGKTIDAADRLIFCVQPEDFRPKLAALQGRLADRCDGTDRGFERNCLEFMCELSIALRSMLVHWNLTDTNRHGSKALTPAQLDAQVVETLTLLAKWEARAEPIAEEELARWRRETTARFKAEAAANPQQLSEQLVGTSLCQYVENLSETIRNSKLRRMAAFRFDGLGRTELGNDYAAFLRHAMYLGASFVTTNPVLVDIAWTADPERWDPVMEALVRANPHADGDELARLATLEVVLANMRLLRPIFLASTGAMGWVSLQVNPKIHGDAKAMITDAMAIHKDLTEKLGGGVPNAVIKIPGTLAGLEACRALAREGLGANLTVNFGLFQQLPVAEVYLAGEAIVGVLSEMNGRLAYPVRDELLARLPDLATYGIDEADAREAAAWAGVAIAKRVHQLFQRKEVDSQRIKPLVASLRIYKDGPGHDRLPSAYPDITEDVGTGILTVFPNIRYAFDKEPQVRLHPDRIGEPVPTRVLNVLAHSEIFRQAYYVADRNWVAEEDERFRPRNLLALEHEAAVAAWPPVYNTLKQFAEAYDRFVERLVSRR